MRIGPDGKLYVGAVMSQGLYRVDLTSGAVERVAQGPTGGADDLVFLPDGTLLWTAYMEGKLMARDPSGVERVVAADLPGIDGIALRKDGRLFVSQCFSADALWEVDLKGGKAPHKILDKLGCLNGFDFGADGMIYGPSWFGGKIVRIDPDKATVETVVSDLKTPAAAKFGPGGKLYVASAGDGRVLEIDTASGTQREIVQLGSGLDNILPLGDDRLLVSSLAEGSVVSVDIGTGAVMPLVQNAMTAPGGLGLCRVNGRDALYVADITTLKAVDIGTGEITEIGRDHPSPGALIVSPLVAATGRSMAMLSSFSGTVQWLDMASGTVAGQVEKLAQPYGVAELPDGSLAVAEFGAGRIARIDTRTASLMAPIATGLDGPTGLLVLPDGTLMVSEAKGGAVAAVRVVDGHVQRVAVGLQSPEGMALLPNGRIVVAEAGARKLLSIDAKGKGQPVTLAADLPIGLPPQSSMPVPFLPTGVAVSGSDIYFSSDTDRTIYRLARKGASPRGASAAPACDISR